MMMKHNNKTTLYDLGARRRSYNRQENMIICFQNSLLIVTCTIVLMILVISSSPSSELYCYAAVPTSTEYSDNRNTPSNYVLSLLASMKNNSNNTTSTSKSLPSPAQEGPIEDALCRIEDLEQANDSQLYTILHELTQTAFFRTFHVNLDRKCPLQSWNTKKSNNHKEEHKGNDKKEKDLTENDNAEDDEEFQCSGGAEELDEDAEPLCSVTGGTDDSFGGGGGFMFATSTPKSPQTTTSTTTSSSFQSNALYSLSKDGYQSQSQQEAFSWKDETDKVIVSKDNIEGGDPTALCSDDVNAHGVLPDTFWNDMCRHLQDDDNDDEINTYGSSNKNVINLLLNPERNTGYNGTHIWRAIYEENCIAVDGDDSHMCFEERVLYRLLSGLHTSTTISIAMNYYPPSKRKNRVDWEPNPQYFMSKFIQDHEHSHNNDFISSLSSTHSSSSPTDHIRSIHFSYAVLLRALHKASPVLYEYLSDRKNIYTGNTVEDETAIVLLKRLLDSSILKSCSNVFTAFDESLMFQESKSSVNDDKNTIISLQKHFKGVFHNVSSILDCVQCQQCKLHGKLTMLGYGTALKILFVNNIEDNLNLKQNEIIALINTIAKLSESLRNIRYLTQLYWIQQNNNNKQKQTNQMSNSDNNNDKQQQQHPPADIGQVGSTTPTIRTQSKSNQGSSTNGVESSSSILSLDVIDTTIGLIALLGRENLISFQRETELIQLALEHNPELLLLAKYYSYDKNKFLKLSTSIVAIPNNKNIYQPMKEVSEQQQQQQQPPDAIVIGSGLAGMAATLNILDRGGRVILLEKEHLLGGNSNKASSGINACCPTNTSSTTDSIERFEHDTIVSAAESAQPALISQLVMNSGSAVEWLRTRVGVDLSLTSQLGGHSDKRTHRPSNGMVGAEIIYGLQKAIKAFEKSGQIQIIVDARVDRLLTADDDDVNNIRRVVGVEYVKMNDPKSKPIHLNSPNVILTTGGFAADRSTGSYLDQYRPELLKMPTTAGTFSTGDGVTLATSLGAGVVDMDKVQVHPTGWVDPTDPDNTSKTLAAELLRGVGGILLNNAGMRFCNELGTRSYVTDKMLSHNETYAKTGKWDIEAPILKFSLLLSSSAASGGTKKHVDLYTRKGLMKTIHGVNELAKWMNVSKSTLVSTLQEYQKDSTNGKDQYGKTNFPGVFTKDLDTEVFHVGTVTPVLHYCMGGLTIDIDGNVLNSETGQLIPGLHAAGEVTGGVHGVNRLAGNSLLECTVYGTIVGEKIPINQIKNNQQNNNNVNTEGNNGQQQKQQLRSISMSELQKHNTTDDCWVAIHGIVYDLTEFADEHPAGAESIHELAGTDGTDAFDAVHNEDMLDDFDEERVGKLLASSS